MEWLASLLLPLSQESSGSDPHPCLTHLSIDRLENMLSILLLCVSISSSPIVRYKATASSLRNCRQFRPWDQMACITTASTKWERGPDTPTQQLKRCTVSN